MPDSLEDNFTDVLGKAMRGLRLTVGELAARSGVPAAAIERVCGGQFDRGILEALAVPLKLNPVALAELPEYRPRAVAVGGLTPFSTSLGGMQVNSFVVCDRQSGAAAAFDTGADCTPVLDFLRSNQLTLQSIFLTHTHADHVADLPRLRSRTDALAYVSNRESADGAEGFDEGREFRCGALRIETRLTWGHSRGGTTYVIHGLERPVAVVGDAMFAGSIGGGAVSYPDALRTNREKILTLPGDAVLCPGHGPMTTVAWEREHNPFFP